MTVQAPLRNEWCDVTIEILSSDVIGTRVLCDRNTYQYKQAES